MEKLNFKMTTSDLILCANLLEEEARQYDKDYSKYEQYISKMYARDRRALKERMIEEVNRRDNFEHE